MSNSTGWMHGCCLERGKHPSVDMGGIITFSCNNLSTVCVKTHCITFFMQIMFSVKKTFFLIQGYFMRFSVHFGK